MGRARAILGLLGFVVAAIAIFAGIFAVVDKVEARKPGVIVVGSKAFSESFVLAEMFAQLIEARAGLVVERRLNLGGTHICFRAVRAGEIDLYPEYTGTGLMAILDEAVGSDPDAVLARVRAGFAPFGLTWLEPMEFNNSYTLAMRTDRARALGIERISDLVGKADLVGGFTAEFLARDDGYPGLKQHYGLTIADPRALEAGLMYQAAANGDVDVVSAYATDARIDKMNLLVLEDDRGFFPPYNAAPLVRQDLLVEHPEIRRALEPLFGALDATQMRRLNGEVDIEGRDPAQVAREYLLSRGLVQ